MRIVIDARAINSTTGRYVSRLLEQLQELDRDNQYQVLIPEEDFPCFVPQAGNFARVASSYRQYSVAEQVGLLRQLRQLRPDLVHFCMPQQPVLYRGPTVTTVHDLTLLRTTPAHQPRMVFRVKQRVGHHVFRHIGASSRAIITPSHFTREEFLKFTKVSDRKVFVTYEAADLPVSVLHAYEPLRGRTYIMYVGTQSTYKNIRRLIVAHQAARRWCEDLELVLVGRLDGRGGQSLRPNVEWVKENGFDGIRFTGYVSDEVLAWLYRNAKAYVFPSLSEGFGLPGLEAMAHGTPVICSRASCLPEVYGDGAGYFDPLSVDSISQAITRVVEDAGYAKALAKRGQERAAEFSWAKTAKKTLSIYRFAAGCERQAMIDD